MNYFYGVEVVCVFNNSHSPAEKDQLRLKLDLQVY